MDTNASALCPNWVNHPFKDPITSFQIPISNPSTNKKLSAWIADSAAW